MENDKIIFLSYATPDRDSVTVYFKDLLARGYDVWMDYVRLKPGQNWDFEIQRALSRAAIIVVFVSGNSIDRRGYVQREIKMVLDKAKEKLSSDIYLIPVLLDDDAQLPDELKHIQAVRASETDCLDKIDDAIRHQLKQVDDRVSEIQGSSDVRWRTTRYREVWEGLPGYESEFGLLNFSSGRYPKIGEVTEIVRGALLSNVADQRNAKLWQAPDRFDFGQQASMRTNTWEAFPAEPNVVERVLSFHYSVHWYGAGAAHPNMHFLSFCFLLDPVIRINRLEEVFEDSPQAFSNLQALVRSELLTPSSEERSLLEDWVFRGTNEWGAFDSFTVSPKGLQIYFSPYQVAPYAAGPQIVEISFDRIKPLLKPWFRSALGIYYFEKTGDRANLGSDSPTLIETASGLLQGISSGRELVVNASSISISDAFPSSSSNVRWQTVFDGKELAVHSVSNFVLRGSAATVLADPRYAWVITFEHCKDISIRDLTFGHVQTGYCQGGVLRFKNCSNIRIKSCDLFGSGTYGLAFEGCADIEIEDTTIRDCSYGIFEIANCRNITFMGCSFRNNREFDLCNFSGEATQIMFRRCLFEKNFSHEAMFNLSKVTQAGSIVYVWDSRFVENDCASFQDESGFFSERKNEFIGNTWQKATT